MAGVTTSALTTGQGRPSRPDEPRWLRLAAVPVMVTIGGLVAVQAQLNGQLADELGGGAVGGLTAALISFGSGLVLLCLAATVSAPMRSGLRAVRRALHDGGLLPWHVVGGAAGACLVATQGLTVGTIGVALFTVAVVGGQTASGLAVDHYGVGPSGAQAISFLRVLGAVLAVGAVALSGSERLGGPDALSSAALGLALLPLAAGAAIAWQQAVNGTVSLTGGAWAATWINFAVGTALLALMGGVALGIQGSTEPLPGTWWLYLGGPMGVVFISLAAVLVRVHGVLVLGLCTVCGQVASALAVDQVVGDGHVGPLTVTGALVTLAGVVLAGLGTRRSSRDRGRPR